MGRKHALDLLTDHSCVDSRSKADSHPVGRQRITFDHGRFDTRQAQQLVAQRIGGQISLPS